MTRRGYNGFGRNLVKMKATSVLQLLEQFPTPNSSNLFKRLQLTVLVFFYVLKYCFHASLKQSKKYKKLEKATDNYKKLQTITKNYKNTTKNYKHNYKQLQKQLQKTTKKNQKENGNGTETDNLYTWNK